MLIPSEDTLISLQSAIAGTFLEKLGNRPSPGMFAKVPAHAVRAVSASLRIDLGVWLVHVREAKVPCMGVYVTVARGHSSWYFGHCRSLDEEQLLYSYLRGDEFILQLHVESGDPALYATGTLPDRLDRLELASKLEDAWGGKHSEDEKRSALDALGHVLNGKGDATLVEGLRLSLKFAHAQPIRAIHVSSDPSYAFAIDIEDPDHGGDFELATYLSLDEVYPLGTFLSPQRRKENGFEEVCDVLAVPRTPEEYGDGCIIIQNKSVETGPTAETRDAERFDKNVAKHIAKGLAQLRGAVKVLKSTEAIFSSEGIELDRAAGEAMSRAPSELTSRLEPLALPHRRAQWGHALVVISCLEVDIDWEQVVVACESAAEKFSYRFSVLDLVELRNFLGSSYGSPTCFETYLVDRFRKMKELRTGCFRFRIRQDY